MAQLYFKFNDKTSQRNAFKHVYYESPKELVYDSGKLDGLIS